MSAPLTTSGKTAGVTAASGGVIALVGNFGYQGFHAVVPLFLPLSFMEANAGFMETSALLASAALGALGRLAYAKLRA